MARFVSRKEFWNCREQAFIARAIAQGLSKSSHAPNTLVECTLNFFEVVVVAVMAAFASRVSSNRGSASNLMWL